MFAMRGSFKRLCLGLSLLSAVHALRLDTFGGQAESKLLMERIVGRESTPAARQMLLQANNDEPDYTCSATKPCKLGCCGPLYVV